MDHIITKSFQSEDIRIITIDDTPWFVAMDIARILGYSSTTKMTLKLDDVDVRKVKLAEMAHLTNRYGNNDLTVINESGLYSSIIGSKLPSARQFKRWVTSEVLPQIRRTGQYVPDMYIPKTYAEALRLAADTADELEASKVIIRERDATIEEKEAVIEVKDTIIQELTPKAETFDDVMSTKNYFPMAEATKMVEAACKINIGRNTMFRILRDKGILTDRQVKDRTGVMRYVNEPYQRYINAGNFIMRMTANEHAPCQVFVSKKGVDFISKTIRSMGMHELNLYTGERNTKPNEQVTLDEMYGI